MEPVSLNPTLTTDLNNDSSKNKKILIIVVVAIIVLLLIASIFIIFASSNKSSQQTNEQNKNNTVVRSPGINNSNPTPTISTSKFKESTIYQDSYELFPGPISGRTLAVVPSKFTIQSSQGQDGTTNIILTANEPDVQMPKISLKPGQKLYMIAPFLRDTIHSEADLGDLFFVVVDENGEIVK